MSKRFESVARALETMLAVALLAAIAFNFVNVIGRYLFGVTFLAADEAQVYILVYIAFVGTAVAALRGMHLRMDVLARMLPRGAQSALHYLEIVSVIVLGALVVFVSYGYVAQMASLDARSQNARIPMWIPHAAVTLGFGLVVLVALRQLVRGGRDPRPPAEHRP